MPGVLKDFGRVGVLAFSITLICSSEAAAQAMSASGSTPISSALPIGSGQTAKVDRFSGELRGQAAYASNVAGGNGTVANLRGVTPEDVTYDIGGTINLQLPVGRQLLFLSANGDLQRHQRNSVLDSENYAIAGGGSGRLGICAESATGNFSRFDTQVQDLTIAVTKNTATQDGVNVTVSCGRGRVFAGIQGTYTKLTNSAKIQGFTDSEIEGGAAWLGYTSNVAGNIALGAQYTKVSYTDRASLPVGAPGSFEQYGASLTYFRKIGMRLNGTTSVSLQTLKAPATSLAPSIEYSNMGADVGLNYRVTSRLGMSLSYNLSNQASPTVNASYVRVNAVHAGVTYALNQRVSLRFGGSNSQADYRGGLPVGLQVRHSEDGEVDGGATVRIGRKVSVSLDARHIDRNADKSIFSYSSNQVTLGLTGAF